MPKQKKEKLVPFSTGFSKRLFNATCPSYMYDKLEMRKIGRHFGITFNFWKKEDENLKMEINLSKPTQDELEQMVIDFLSNKGI